jgi:hypothetical protein
MKSVCMILRAASEACSLAQCQGIGRPCVVAARSELQGKSEAWCVGGSDVTRSQLESHSKSQFETAHTFSPSGDERLETTTITQVYRWTAHLQQVKRRRTLIQQGLVVEDRHICTSYTSLLVQASLLEAQRVQERRIEQQSRYTG